MNYHHQGLAAGRWKQMKFPDQMANIRSEVERALNWRAKNNPEYSQRAFERALELLDLTLNCQKDFHRLRELARVREALADYFFGENEFKSTDQAWRKYFLPFNFLARRESMSKLGRAAENAAEDYPKGRTEPL